MRETAWSLDLFLLDSILLVASLNANRHLTRSGVFQGLSNRASLYQTVMNEAHSSYLDLLGEDHWPFFQKSLFAVGHF